MSLDEPECLSDVWLLHPSDTSHESALDLNNDLGSCVAHVDVRWIVLSNVDPDREPAGSEDDWHGSMQPNSWVCQPDDRLVNPPIPFGSGVQSNTQIGAISLRHQRYEGVP